MKNILVISEKLTVEEERFLLDSFLDKTLSLINFDNSEERKNVDNIPRIIYLSTISFELSRELQNDWIDLERSIEIAENVYEIIKAKNIHCVYANTDYVFTSALMDLFPNVISSESIFMDLIDSELY